MNADRLLISLDNALRTLSGAAHEIGRAHV